jgi:hypothetical protein
LAGASDFLALAKYWLFREVLRFRRKSLSKIFRSAANPLFLLPLLKNGGEGGIRTLPTQEISIDIGRT